jgi:hypothetical protein
MAYTTNHLSDYLAAIQADNSLTQDSKTLIAQHLSAYFAYSDARDNPENHQVPASNLLKLPNYVPGNQPTSTPSYAPTGTASNQPGVNNPARGNVNNPAGQTYSSGRPRP